MANRTDGEGQEADQIREQWSGLAGELLRSPFFVIIRGPILSPLVRFLGGDHCVRS